MENITTKLNKNDKITAIEEGLDHKGEDNLPF